MVESLVLEGPPSDMVYVPPVQYTAPLGGEGGGRNQSNPKGRERDSERPPPPPPQGSGSRSEKTDHTRSTGCTGEKRQSHGVSRSECPPSSHAGRNGGSGSQGQQAQTQQDRGTSQERIMDQSSKSTIVPPNSQGQGQGQGGGIGRGGGRSGRGRGGGRS
jgi:hypothetical protein